MPLPPWGSLDSGEDGAGMGWVTDWSAQAACRTTDPDELFVQGAAQNRAKSVCHGCPVRAECLADALDNRVEFGVWGGMTERERRALLRRRPEVRSWRQFLESAKEKYERSGGGPGPRFATPRPPRRDPPGGAHAGVPPAHALGGRPAPGCQRRPPLRQPLLAVGQVELDD